MIKWNFMTNTDTGKQVRLCVHCDHAEAVGHAENCPADTVDLSDFGVSCEGCGRTVLRINNPCLDCCKARCASVAANGKCKCGAKRKPDKRVRKAHNRKWIHCNRCLGTITQLT